MASKAAVTLGWVALGLGGLALSLPSCSRKADWAVSEWHAGQPAEHIPKPTHLTATKLGGTMNGQKIVIQQQSVAGVPLEESFQKSVWRKGELQWTKARHLEGENLPTAESVTQELKNRAWVKENSEKISQRFNCEWKSEPRPFLRFRGSWNLIYKRECEEKNGRLWLITLNSKGSAVRRELAGAAFDWQKLPVNLFPRGPKGSRLERMTISVSATPFFLFTPNIEVTSDAGFKFSDAAQLQSTAPNQESFDMVQAYYYATEALNWVSERYQFQLDQLKIRTQVGHPEKSNVAFYHAHEIRLGTGDDVSFSHIPWDPSIVMHETMHAVIEALTGLPFQGEGGSLQEALADALTAMRLSNPNMGESAYKKGNYQRTLDNSLNVSEKNGGLYHDSLIVSGTIWHIRQRTSPQVAENLVGYLLAHLSPDSKLADAGKLMRAWVASCGTECEPAHRVLDQRGWP